MRHLSTLTNILPVIAKSDSLSHTQTLTLKVSLLRDLRANNIPIFTFGKSISELERNVVNGIPWAVSCLRDDAAETGLTTGDSAIGAGSAPFTGGSATAVIKGSVRPTVGAVGHHRTNGDGTVRQSFPAIGLWADRRATHPRGPN